MIPIFDYLFFRANSYYRRHKEGSPIFAAVTLVSIIQLLLIVNILIILNLFGLFHLTSSESLTKLWTVATSFILVIANSFRYSNRDLVAKLESKWRSEHSRIRFLKFCANVCLISCLILLLFLRGGKLG